MDEALLVSSTGLQRLETTWLSVDPFLWVVKIFSSTYTPLRKGGSLKIRWTRAGVVNPQTFPKCADVQNICVAGESSQIDRKNEKSVFSRVRVYFFRSFAQIWNYSQSSRQVWVNWVFRASWVWRKFLLRLRFLFGCSSPLCVKQSSLIDHSQILRNIQIAYVCWWRAWL